MLLGLAVSDAVGCGGGGGGGGAGAGFFLQPAAANTITPANAAIVIHFMLLCFTSPSLRESSQSSSSGAYVCPDGVKYENLGP
jgi:hypothetical protein